VSQESGITQDDLVSTLQYYSLVKYWKGKHIVLKNKVREGGRKVQRGRAVKGSSIPSRIWAENLADISTRVLWSSSGRRSEAPSP